MVDINVDKNLNRKKMQVLLEIKIQSRSFTTNWSVTSPVKNVLGITKMDNILQCTLNSIEVDANEIHTSASENIS